MCFSFFIALLILGCQYATASQMINLGGIYSCVQENDEWRDSLVVSLHNLYHEGKYKTLIDLWEKSKYKNDPCAINDLQTLNYVAWVYSETGENGKAEVIVDRLLTCTKPLGKYEYAKALYCFAYSKYCNGQDSIIPILDESISLFSDIDSNIIDLNRTLLLKAICQEDMNLLFQIKSTLEKNNRTETDVYCKALETIAGIYFDNGDYIHAIDLQKQALQKRRDFQSENHPAVVLSMQDLGTYYCSSSYYQEAFIVDKEVEAMYDKMEEIDSINMIYNITALCVINNYLGRYQEAIIYGEKALALSDLLLGKQSEEYILCLANYAFVYMQLHDYDRVINIMEKVVSKKKEQLNGARDVIEYYHYLLNLSDAFSMVDRQQEAIELCKDAVNIISKEFGENNARFFEAKSYLIIKCCNDNKELIEQLTSCLNGLNTYSGENLLYCNILKHIADAYKEIGDREKCLSTIIQVLNIAEKLCGKDNPEYLFYLGTAASMHFYFDSDKSTALALYSDYLVKTKNNVRATLLGMDKSDRFDYWKYYNYAMNTDFPSASIQRKNDPEWQKVFYDLLLFKKGILLQTEIYERYVMNKYHFTNTNWRDIRCSLTKNDIAIEFEEVALSNNDKVICALCLKNNYEAPKLIEICKSSDLDSLSTNLIEIYNIIWRPLEQELSKINNVYFSPSGIISSIPIENAIQSRDNRLISELYKMYRLSSTREIIHIEEDNRISNIALYGGINYYASISDIQNANTINLYQNHTYAERALIDIDRGLLNELEGSEEELLCISRIIPDSISYRLFVRNEATEESVISLSGTNTNLLHIDTHGFYWNDKNYKYNSHSLIDNLISIDDSEEDIALSRSGLFLAGANLALSGQTIPEKMEDGILTAKEISRLDFKNLNLVVLAACKTGLGDIHSDGILGLQRGFKKAGVNSIIMSLWNVSNIATTMLMIEFYKHFFSGKSKQESLLFAQKYIRDYKDETGNNIFADPY